MNLKEKLDSNKFVICAEVNPPKGASPEDLLNQISLVKDKVDAFNVTDNSLSTLRMSAIAFSKLLVNNGYEPILHMTCRDRNRLALQSDLLGANALGIKNVLAITGDNISLGDFPEAKQVFDLDSVHLINLISKLNKGTDLSSKKLQSKTDYHIGAAFNQNTDFLDGQILKIKKKVIAGADFFQTQPVFDIRQFENFMNLLKEKKIIGKKKVIAGIILLKSYNHAVFLNNNVPGIHIPKYILEKLKNTDENSDFGLNVAADLVSKLRKICNGILIVNIRDYKKLNNFLEVV